MINHRNESGAAHWSTVAVIIMTLLFAGAGSFAIWSYIKYTQANDDVQAQIDTAVSKAKKDQADKDAQLFAEREKEPNRIFAGPTDYGRVTFDYPKTWSVYEATDITVSGGGTYKAYLNPVTVPAVINGQRFALRVTIEQKETEKVIASYNSRVKKGDLKSSVFSANGLQATRIDGLFSEDVRGSAVIFKIRDKTLTVQTDADTFKKDFDRIIKTIKFNQ